MDRWRVGPHEMKTLPALRRSDASPPVDTSLAPAASVPPPLAPPGLPPRTPLSPVAPQLKPPSGQRKVSLAEAREPFVPKGTAHRHATGELFAAGGPSVSDVRQGRVGDCWFLAALASVTAHRPHFVRDMIREHEDGGVEVRFFFQSAPGVFAEAWVHVSRRLPGDAAGPLLTRPADRDHNGRRELWVPLVEKAFARFAEQQLRHGLKGYDAINGGDLRQGIEALTGASAHVTLCAGASEATWQHLRRSNAGQAVIAGSLALPADQRIKPRHAYSVLDAYEENGRRFVMLRNPWGNAPDRDGVIVMPFEHFRSAFFAVGAAEQNASLRLSF
jgi:hypothetical protein